MSIMKSFFLLLLTIFMATAAPHARSAPKKCDPLQHILLKEIIVDINEMKAKELPRILVDNVITPEKCGYETLCKAGAVLSASGAEKFGHTEEDWLLPRRLIAYTRNIHCNIKPTIYQVEFLQLLKNIQMCAQKEFANNCD